VIVGWSRPLILGGGKGEEEDGGEAWLGRTKAQQPLLPPVLSPLHSTRHRECEGGVGMSRMSWWGWLDARGRRMRTLFCTTATYQRQAGFVATPALAAAVLASLRRRAHSRQGLAPCGRSMPVRCVRVICVRKAFEDLGGDGNLESRWLGQAKGGLVVNKGRDLGMQGGRRGARGTVAVFAWFRFTHLFVEAHPCLHAFTLILTTAVEQSDLARPATPP